MFGGVEISIIDEEMMYSGMWIRLDRYSMVD